MEREVIEGTMAGVAGFDGILGLPAQGCRGIWSDAFDKDILVGVFSQLKAEHIPAALHESNLAVTILENVETTDTALGRNWRRLAARSIFRFFA